MLIATGTWAARYNTWLLKEMTPKGVVFSFLSTATGTNSARPHAQQWPVSRHICNSCFSSWQYVLLHCWCTSNEGTLCIGRLAGNMYCAGNEGTLCIGRLAGSGCNSHSCRDLFLHSHDTVSLLGSLHCCGTLLQCSLS